MRKEATRGLVLCAVVCSWLTSAVHSQGTALVNTDRVSVRARPSIFSEVVAQLRQGNRVAVLEVIKHANPRPGEPSEWVKIQMPSTALVWVNAAHLDMSRKTVTATRLNVRAGPGLNFSVVGSLTKGDPVRPVRVLDDWVEIEPPPNCWAYVNRLYVTLEDTKQEESTSRSGRAAKAEHARLSVVQPEQRTVVLGRNNGGLPRSPQGAVSIPQPVSIAQDLVRTEGSETQQSTVGKPAPSEDSVQPAAAGGPDEKSVRSVEPNRDKRSVVREGLVIRTVTSRSPSHYRLKSMDTGKVISFLRAGSDKVELGRYVGQRVLVEGVETWDSGSSNIPVILVGRIEPLSK